MTDLYGTLKQYFGFTSFRPFQEEIIRDSLAGRDVVAVLPTGGGKSLCFQLSALMRPGLTLVVSPLISLMKDQVDAMRASGVAATFLNSSLEAHELRARLVGLESGQFKLLYVAPERLFSADFLSDLRRWEVSLIAVDEAHCISEWGHDFRPEYRRLAELRGFFPETPLMALTATATEPVRADIIRYLKLREPRCYVASFNRPNLTYRVFQKEKPYEQLLNFVRQRTGENGIVYCQSRKTSESVAKRLDEDGITAKPYHAGLTSEERSRHQDLFLRDEVNVICATIAFGMGINKPNVRFVIHYDLPKNIEGYYQETGRAGRDGLPSDCFLLFSAGDVAKQAQFIEELSDTREQEVAREKLRQMVHYGESAQCRRSQLLRYFGEEFGVENCQGCDNCLSPRDTFDGTAVAQKFLSCTLSIHRKSGFSVGLSHVIEVLTGAKTGKIRRWGHEELPLYNAGKEHSRPEWARIGRELVRLGFLEQAAGKFSVLKITQEGRDLLNGQKTARLTKQPDHPEAKTHRVGDIVCDEALFERLRQLRKRLANERDVPAYIIFSDVALRQMARLYPANEREFIRISGVGQKKLEEFGSLFLAEIAAHLQDNARQTFVEDFSFPAPLLRKRGLNDTQRETLKRFRAGESAEQIAQARALVPGTIYGHLAIAVENGEEVDLDRFLTPDEQVEIANAFAKIGPANLTGIREALDERFDYGLLRLYRSVTQGLVK